MNDTSNTHLTGKLLIAMPSMSDPQFQRSVVYVCAHSSKGAMGLLVNRVIPDLSVAAFLDRLGVTSETRFDRRPVHYGGPMEPERGFVLHSTEYDAGEATIRVNKGFSMTASMDILEDIGMACGPNRALIAMGYSGWGAGQLDREILANGWLTLTPGPGLVFSEDDDTKWVGALNMLGVQPKMLSAMAGHA